MHIFRVVNFSVTTASRVADITIGYALYLGELQGFSERYTPDVRDYLARLKARPAFAKASAIGADKSNFK